MGHQQAERLWAGLCHSSCLRTLPEPERLGDVVGEPGSGGLPNCAVPAQARGRMPLPAPHVQIQLRACLRGAETGCVRGGTATKWRMAR